MQTLSKVFESPFDRLADHTFFRIIVRSGTSTEKNMILDEVRSILITH